MLLCIKLFSFLFLSFTGKVAAQCSGVPDGFYGDSQQCDRYIECSGGQVVADQLCGDGLVFNINKSPESPACELPFGIDCSDRPYLQPAQPTKDCPRQFGLFRDDRDCSIFIQCDQGDAFEKQCPENLYFNDQLGVCDWSDEVEGCGLPRSLPFDCPQYNEEDYKAVGDPRFPDAADCRKLWVCIRHEYKRENVLLPRHLSCEEGMVYNIDEQICDIPENVRGCENYYRTERRRNK